MEALENIFLSPFFEFAGVEFALINFIIFAALIFLGFISVRRLKTIIKKQNLSKKKFEFEGINIPVIKLVIQVFWLSLLFLAHRSLSINNPHVDLHSLMAYEFIRIENFYLSVYHIFFGLGIYIVGRILLSLVRIYLIRRLRKLTRTDEGTAYVYFQLIKYVLISIGLILILRSMGVQLSTFMDAILFLSVGVALGMQDIFKDFFSGLLLLFESSVKVGDIIEVENQKANSDNFVAKILEINVRTSKVETRDGKVLIIPNSHLTFQKVNNWTTGNHETRFQIRVTVHYNADLELVKKIMLECAQKHPMILNKKDIIVRLLNFGLDGYEMDLVFWANKNFFIEIHKSDIRFAIDTEFKKHGIGYPYRQMDVHMPSNSKTDLGINPTESE